MEREEPQRLRTHSPRHGTLHVEHVRPSRGVWENRRSRKLALLPSPLPSSLKHAVKPSCERCAPYTRCGGAASSPKTQGGRGGPSRQASLSPQAAALTSHPRAVIFLHHGPPGTTPSTEICRSASSGLDFLIQAPPQGEHRSNKCACSPLVTVLVTSIFTLSQGP